MRDGERRHGRKQAAETIDEQHERKDEQQMVDAEQNVLRAEHEVGLHDVERPGGFRDHDARLGGHESMRERRAVQIIDAQQHVRGGLREPRDDETRAAQPVRAAQRTVLQLRIVDDIAAHAVNEPATGRDLGLEHVGQPARHRDLPLRGEHVRLRLAEAEIGGTQLVRRRRARHETEPQHTEPEPACRHRGASVLGRPGHSTTTS
jgi:hypothetical protein